MGSYRVFSSLNAVNNMMGVTYAAGASTFSGVSVSKDSTAFMKVFSASNEPIDVEVPSWYPLLARLVSSSWFNSGTNSLAISSIRMQNALTINNQATTNIIVARQPSDTMNCFCFVGVPPVTNNRLT